MAEPAPDPWNASRVDPRQKLPSLSADQWLDALRHAARAAAPGALKGIAGGIADHVVQQGVDAFFSRSAGVYVVNGTPVSAMPFFRIANGYSGASEQKKEQVFAATGRRSQAFSLAVHRCTYGRCTPDELRLVTQALIDAGKLDEVRKKYDAMPYTEFQKHGLIPRPVDEANAIKLLQWEYGLGIDCAGYVQLAFLDVHGGSRQTWGFESVGNEDLTDLRGNEAFQRDATPLNARPGDLIILNPPRGDDVGHTVLVREHRVLTPEQMRGVSAAASAFATPHDKVHVIEVHGSWGAGQNGNLEIGGVQTRQFLYNERTGQWADVNGDQISPQPVGRITVTR